MLELLKDINNVSIIYLGLIIGIAASLFSKTLFSKTMTTSKSKRAQRLTLKYIYFTLILGIVSIVFTLSGSYSTIRNHQIKTIFGTEIKENISSDIIIFNFDRYSKCTNIDYNIERVIESRLNSLFETDSIKINTRILNKYFPNTLLEAKALKKKYNTDVIIYGDVIEDCSKYPIKKINIKYYHNNENINLISGDSLTIEDLILGDLIFEIKKKIKTDLKQDSEK